MKRKPLHKLSFHIHPEGEEAVCALMEDLFGRPPVIRVDYKTRRTTVEMFSERKEDLGSTPLQRLRRGLKAIRAWGLETGVNRLRVTPVEHEDWAESWKLHFHPFEIGSHLLVRPSWSKKRPRKGQKEVVLDPGLSFGTGQHPTTRFCLRVLAGSRKADCDQSFLDMGTGSGILAIAAVKLGYRPVHAFDFDPNAVRISRENALLNGVARPLSISQCDLSELPHGSHEKFDVIAANLSDDVLLANCRKIVQRLKPGGRLILAGILHMKFPDVRRSFEKLGTKLARTKLEREWRSGVFSF